MLPSNYLEDVNRFRLSGPPDWFRKQLWEFDNSLVIVPSRQGFYYRLAQRRPIRLADKVAFEAMKEQADTAMLMSYGLVPVTTIMATANWSNPLIFMELTNRAPWRLGGADKVNKDLEAFDREDTLRRRAETDEHLTYLGKDAWTLYRTKIGLGRSWSTSKQQSKPAIPLAKHVDRTIYYPGFSGGL